MKQYGRMVILAAASALCIAAASPLYALAADASVTFGSNWYNEEEGEMFPVGVYINAEGRIGEYRVTIKYDPQRMAYVSGADEADESTGTLTLTGTGAEERIKYWLQFRPLGSGEASLEVTGADVKTEEGGDYSITKLGNAPIYIAESESMEAEPEGEDGSGIEENLTGEEDSSAEENLAGEEDSLAGENPDGESEGFTGEEEDPAPEGDAFSARMEDDLTVPEGEAEGQIMGFSDQEGQEEGDFTETEITEGQAVLTGAEARSEKKHSIIFNPYVVIVLVAAALIVGVELILFGVRKLLKRKGNDTEETDIEESGTDDIEENAVQENVVWEPAMAAEEETEEEDGELMIYDLKSEVDSMMQDKDRYRKLETPVIRVSDVTMEFHLSSSNPSGLKDYFIQMAKRQITYRKLYALYHVSFNVYKGEVVGIIGTNGSGKSTLLKIVSGALKPTEGRVDVNRKKVQLLTLGTGFDGELTARENVYLNGSIIGYSREFLDSHYEDIVRFAELEDFMEEKVKNFSSGMVSRLGFAIATAGDAAEILILDEVLSVGDEFFRKKSLNRIKELIHSGSTVLMVSHGMGTILEHCTKCVWIEKGRLQMVGEPKEVCSAYRKMTPETVQ